MVRNFRVRRELGLLPDSRVSPDPLDSRWLRQRFRPTCLTCAVPAVTPRETAADPRRIADLKREVGELQQRAEWGYREVNAERRNIGALKEGLRKQGESVSAIDAEGSRLRAQLEALRSKMRAQAGENVQLRQRLSLTQQDRANTRTQAAVLASALDQLAAPPAPTLDGLAGGSARRELELCRAQIATVIAENAALEQRLALARAPVTERPERELSMSRPQPMRGQADEARTLAEHAPRPRVFPTAVAPPAAAAEGPQPWSATVDPSRCGEALPLTQAGAVPAGSSWQAAAHRNMMV